MTYISCIDHNGTEYGHERDNYAINGDWVVAFDTDDDGNVFDKIKVPRERVVTLYE